MPFWVLSLIVIFWWSSHVKSGPITQNDSTGLYFDDAHDDTNDTLQFEEDNPESAEELSSNYSMTEGDIMQETDRNAMIQRTWLTSKIPYVIDDSIRHRTQDILKAIKMISDPTCLTFHQRKTEHDYLLFRKSRGCASYVGCIGGGQPVFIGFICGVGNIAHEILHALGFFHEHTRMDRDQYVVVHTKNIKKGAEKNFAKQHGGTWNVSYDVLSILHYGSKYFSGNGKETIEPIHPETKMGQRQWLTVLDIQKIRFTYNCDSSEN